MKWTIIILLIFTTHCLLSQKYYTRSGKIVFTSEAPIESIESINNKATSIFDVESGAIEWAVLIKAFEFEKALMQTHFNENYMESSKMPKAQFKGKIEEISKVDFSKDGTYNVSVSGSLTIHGVTNEISTTAVFKIENDNITASSSLKVLVADYNISIPKVVRENIAREVAIDVFAQYELFKKS